MEKIANESVDLIITSPPYWQLKDYWVDNQIWFNDSYEEYINNLNLVWKESYRVLKKWCRLCINIWDQFARSVYYGRYKVVPIQSEIIKFCEAIWFDFMWTIIWQKKTTMNTTWWATIMWSYPYPRNWIITIDYEYILIFKKLWNPPKVDKKIKEASKLSKEEWKEYFSWHWYFNWAKQNSHIAMFPEELPKRLIKMFSFVWDTILDPFLWSWTTAAVAKKLWRNSIWYEINNDFISIIKNKIWEDLYTKIETIKEINTNCNFKEEIEKLPYKFVDYHKFDKKIDPKKLQFGSKISLNQWKEKIKYFTVKEILSPEIIKLNNNLTIRLIGVKEIKSKSKKAIDFLYRKTKWQKILLKYDNIKYDKEKNLLAYMYLRNKTFLNAYLIKEGLVSVDTSYDYKNKNKFIKLLQK